MTKCYTYYDNHKDLSTEEKSKAAVLNRLRLQTNTLFREVEESKNPSARHQAIMKIVLELYLLEIALHYGD